MADETSTETTPVAAPEEAASPSQGAEPVVSETQATDEMPEGARKALEAARRDAKEAKKAQKSAEQAATASVEAARTEMAQAIAKALGVTTEEAPDPAALTQQLADRTTSERSAQLELAVWRAAGTSGADPSALLDSRRFMDSIRDVDVTDASAVAEAITAAVAANAALKATPGARLPAANPAAGASAAGAPSLGEQIEAASKAGDTRTALRLKTMQLLNTPIK